MIFVTVAILALGLSLLLQAIISEYLMPERPDDNLSHAKRIWELERELGYEPSECFGYNPEDFRPDRPYPNLGRGFGNHFGGIQIVSKVGQEYKVSLYANGILTHPEVSHGGSRND